jgi:hypothetical protein
MIRRARPARLALIVLSCGAIDVSVFGVLVWRSVTIEHAQGNDVERRFSAVRAGLPSAAPIVDIDDAVRVTG